MGATCCGGEDDQVAEIVTTPPKATTNWKDDMNTWIVSPILKILGVGVSAVGSGASAIGTLISYFLQFGLLFVFMFILLPMLRAMS